MTKLPVGKTIRFAYGFTFGHLGAIIALIWLPIVSMALVSFLPQAIGVPAPGTADLTPAQAAGAGLWGLFGSFASLVLSAMAYQAVAELALGLRAPGPNYYFSLDRPVWRLLGAIVLLILLVMLFALMVFGGVALLGWLASMLGKTAGAVVASVAALAGIVFFSLVIVRMGFLLVPATVAEGRIDLARSWTLTYGNFWRIVVTEIAVLLPLMILAMIGLAAIFARDFPALMALMKDTSAQAEAARTAIVQHHLPMVFGLELILMPFSMGLATSASAFAYRALLPPQTDMVV
jgi:hypothetical protein